MDKANVYPQETLPRKKLRLSSTLLYCALRGERLLRRFGCLCESLSVENFLILLFMPRFFFWFKDVKLVFLVVFTVYDCLVSFALWPSI